MITGVQIKMARAALSLDMKDLAKSAEVSLGTIVRIESGKDAKASTLERIKGDLEKRGIVFTPEGCVCPPKKL